MTSIATDYRQDTGYPQPFLQAIAEVGFTHVHWCHHWCTDFLYSAPEIDQIHSWLSELGLGVTDLHASAGKEKAWASPLEYERLAGVELVANRLEMSARLGCDVAVLHIPLQPEEEVAVGPYWDCVRRSLDALQTHSARTGVRIALENGGKPASWLPVQQVFAEYPPEFIGLCYDCGHGNMSGDGLDRLAEQLDRLICIHLHDNDGSGDLHGMPFSGTVDWERLTRLIAQSDYRKWVNLELSQARSGYEDERQFLLDAHAVAERLTAMIEAHSAQ